MSKPLSEQVAGLESHLKTLIDINAGLVGENADLIAERDGLADRVDAMRVSHNTHSPKSSRLTRPVSQVFTEG